MDTALARQVEEALLQAFRSGDASRLNVLGYGEISCVVGWPTEEPQYACKRLPTFRSKGELDAFEAVLGEYLETLTSGGVAVLETTFIGFETAGGWAGYCVQPALPKSAMVVGRLRDAEPSSDAAPMAFVENIAAAVVAVVNDAVGLDAQLSNWVLVDGELRYIDITTPLLRDERGRIRTDPGLFLRAYPWPMRWPIRKFVLPSVVARYHDPRTVLLDICANLQKERLQHWLDVFMAALNPLVDEPITPQEVARDYKSDARMWAVMQRLRRWDRRWQMSIRRRPYPFLLPPQIER